METNKNTNNSWLDDKLRYEALAEGIEPAALLGPKDAPGWAALWWLGAVLSLGLLAALLPKRRFLEDFGTTVGPFAAFPRDRGEIPLRFLRHELRHVTQFVRFGYAVPLLGWVPGRFGRKLRALVGVLPYALVYLLLPLPLGLALGRYLLEADAEVAAWRTGLSEGSLAPAEVRARAERFGRILAGRDYAFAWPWAVAGLERRAERETARIRG